MRHIQKTVLASAVLTIFCIGFIALHPVAVSAQSIELQGVVPSLDADITPPDNEKAGEENFYTFWFKGQIGTQYEANFTASEEPAFTFVSGGSMNLADNVHYDADSQTFTVTYTAEKLEQIDAQSSSTLEEGQTLTIIAVSFPVDEGENGPGQNTIGSWIATNFQEWSLITPSSENNTMGARVRGDAGDTGSFTMFMSQASVNTMAEYDNAHADEYTGSDFALYTDGAVAKSEDIQDVDGGGTMLNFDATIPEESHTQSTSVFSTQDSQGSALSIAVGPKAAVTLHTDKESVKKLRYITLSGKIKSGLAGKTVKLLRRTIDTEYTVIATATTKKNGKFHFKIKVRKMSGFQAKFKKHKSEEVFVMLK